MAIIKTVRWEECEQWSSTNRETSASHLKYSERRSFTFPQRETSWENMKLKQLNYTWGLPLHSYRRGYYTERRALLRPSPSTLILCRVAAHQESIHYFAIWLAPQIRIRNLPLLLVASQSETYWGLWGLYIIRAGKQYAQTFINTFLLYKILKMEVN